MTDQPRNRIEEALRANTYRATSVVKPTAAGKSSSGQKVPVAEAINRRTGFFLFLVALMFLVLPALGYGSLLIYRHFKAPVPLGGTGASAPSSDADNAALLKEVGADIELPAGEDPTITTIADLAPLKGQAFFADAAVGDKVLIFSKAKKAVLFRPSTKKVISVAPTQ